MTTACGASGAGGRQGSGGFRLGYQPALAQGLFYIADKKGWFEEAGLKTSLRLFDSGSPEVSAMSGGSLSAGAMGSTPALIAGAQGLPLPIVTVYEDPSLGYSIFADDRIDDIRDLKGARVGTTLGSNYQYFLDRTLAKFGLTEADLEMTYAEPGEVETSFIAGELDAIVPTEASRFIIPEKKPETKIIFRARQFTEPPGPIEPFRVYGVITAPESILSDPATIRKFLDVYHHRVVDYITSPQTRDRAVKSLLSWQHNVVKSEISEKAVRKQISLTSFPDRKDIKRLLGSRMFLTALAKQMEFLMSIDQIQDTPKPESLIDSGPISSL